jgi:hypothetical protein
MRKSGGIFNPVRAIVVAALAALATGSTHASAIREFDLQTVESLGRQLYEHENQSPKSLSGTEAHALDVAKTALGTRIDQSHKFIVLHDPTKSGYLVYALATSKDPDDVVFGIHYRVTISADGNKPERVEGLSRTRLVVNKSQTSVAVWANQLLGTKPLETHVYLSLLHSTPLYIRTSAHTMWKIENGHISKTKGSQ